MEEYRFPTKSLGFAGEECTQPCHVRQDGTMIGSNNCVKCEYNCGTNYDGNNPESFTRIKCSRLQEAITSPENKQA